MVLNHFIAWAARAIGAPADFRQFAPGAITLFTILGCAAGTGVFLFLRNRNRSVWTWRIVAYGALLLSYAPDVFLLAGGADERGAVALLLMHTVTGVLLTEALANLAWASARGKTGPQLA